MDVTRILIVGLLSFALGTALSPSVTATHSCVDDVPCYPHPEDPPHPKTLIQQVGDTVRCLILAQPPTACV